MQIFPIEFHGCLYIPLEFLKFKEQSLVLLLGSTMYLACTNDFKVKAMIA